MCEMACAETYLLAGAPRPTAARLQRVPLDITTAHVAGVRPNVPWFTGADPLGVVPLSEPI